jgi:hypothetical protein
VRTLQKTQPVAGLPPVMYASRQGLQRCSICEWRLVIED